MADPRWLTKAEVLDAHERQLAEHGGPSGVRDDGLLESALARPENLQAYGDPDVADLAAAYAFGPRTIRSSTATSGRRSPPARLSYC